MPVNRDVNDYLAILSWYNELLGIINAIDNDDSVAVADIREMLAVLASKLHKDIKETVVA